MQLLTKNLGIPLVADLLGMFGFPAILVLAAWAIIHRRRAAADYYSAEVKLSPKYSNKVLFPPSRRHILHRLVRGQAQTTCSAPGMDVSPGSLATKALPTSRSPTSDDEAAELLTPTGLTLKDVRSLGPFPDYALLSGVPDPEPCGEEFDISRAKFRPFRPFRWGYHQTMDYWIELEQNYHASMAARQELLGQHHDLIMYHDPGSELACYELMEMVIRFLCRRYPQYFRLEAQGEDTIFVNKLLQTRTVIASPAGAPASQQQQHPLEILAATVPEDFAVMLRDEQTGAYHLRAALICSSVGWDAGAKRGLSLGDIHAPVVDYSARMGLSMDRYFARLATDQPVQRCSWTLEDSAPLFSSPAAAAAAAATATADVITNAAIKDVVAQDRESSGGGGGGWSRCALDEGEVTIEDVQLRCDWQTLRRLPCSGAVVFNFKAVFTPLVRLREEPFVPALLATVLRDGRPDLVVPHKAFGHVRDLVLPVLEAWAEEQVEAGVVPKTWETRTLDEHPFYPGWEERWRAEQGF